MKNIKNKIIVSLMIVLSLSFLGCGKGTSSTGSKTTGSEAKIHFIDTGNSDSILIQNKGENMIIDGGNLDDDEKVVNYLKTNGVKDIKYMVISHPHADHIGALDSVIKDFNVENVMVGTGESNTKTYNSLKSLIAKNNINVINPKEKEGFKIGDSSFTVYNAKSNTHKDLNNKSLVLKYSNGEDDFLFTGDAEKEVENEIASDIGDIEVLKSGHHGSSSSTSQKLIEKTTPETAILLTGKNSYGHPHKEVVDLLNSKDITIYRSDVNGDIVATSTGNDIKFKFSK